MDRLVDLIKVYDDALSHNTCDYLINVFESSEDYHEKIENDRKPNFTQYNLTQNIDAENDIEKSKHHKSLIRDVYRYRDQYYNFVYKECFPSSHAFEQFRIKRYNVGGNDAFDTHVDVTDYESSRRFLSFMWYLNDVDNGGETVFKDLSITPKKGRLVIFPPLWMYPHMGKEPVSNTKYILTTYLHYR